MIEGNSNNITNLAASRSCTSCQMCSAVCNRHAINISLDKEGFYTPTINKDLCVECGECVSVCAKYDDSIKITTDQALHTQKLYAASAMDDAIVRLSTSGGIADILAKSLIREGYSVIGVKYNPTENRAEHAIATTSKETDAFRGSKYIQSYSVDAFRHLVKSSAKEKFAVFGLPCQIYAINKFVVKRNKKSNFLLVDLYCHGCPSMLVWDKVSQSIKNRMHSDSFTSVNWRSKYRGWGRFFLEVMTKEGKLYQSRPGDNGFFDLFFSNHLLKPSCTSCCFRSTLAYTDIRLGDFWGPDYKSNLRGVSAVSVATKDGADAIERVKEYIFCEEKDYGSFLPYQSWGHSYDVDIVLRNKLLSLLSDDSTSIQDCLGPLKKKNGLIKGIKQFLKVVLSYLPPSIERKLI